MSTLFDMDEVPVASSKSNEWYTPSRYIEAARAVMGGIDLDPASCELANSTVKAARYYTKEDNGLAQEWEARTVWLNPPFAAENELNPIRTWVGKLIAEHKAGKVGQAVLLVSAGTERLWFQALWEYCICFSDHQIVYARKGQPPDHKRHGDCFVYLGPHITRFAEHFTEFGPVVTPDGIHRRPSPVTQPSLFQ